MLTSDDTHKELKRKFEQNEYEPGKDLVDVELLVAAHAVDAAHAAIMLLRPPMPLMLLMPLIPRMRPSCR